MSEFTEHLKEVFEVFGPVNGRRMFGGHGLFHEGLMFGLVADDVLYLKADKTNAPDFESRDLGQFEFEKGGKMVKMSFYLAPDQIFDNREEAALWARRAYEAAVRAKKKRHK
jgi:DNA transformation protein